MQTGTYVNSLDWPALLRMHPTITEQKVQAIEHYLHLSHNQQRRDKRQGWQTWVHAHWRNKKRVLFKWIRGECSAWGLVVKNDIDQWRANTPHSIAEAECEAWSKHWQPTESPPTYSSMTSDHPLPDWRHIREVVQHYPKDKAKGADGWQAQELQQLPDTTWVTTCRNLWVGRVHRGLAGRG